MAHAVSTSFTRFDHMSPPALVLTTLLHVVVAVSLWWVSPLKIATSDVEDAIEVSIEKAPIAEPPPQAALTPPAPTPPARPAPAVAAPPRTAPGVALGVPLPTPEASSDPQRREQPQTVEPPQQEATPPTKPVEDVVPPPLPPAPPPTALDFPKPAPPPTPQTAPRPPQRAPTTQELRPSPLSQLPQRQPNTEPQAAAPPSSTFQNPATAASRNKAIENYLWQQVVRKMSQYLPNLQEKNEEGTVVVRFVIARDGRLLEAGILRSSGLPLLDKAMLDTVRAAAPYAPFPPEIADAQATFSLPLSSKYRR